MLRRQPQRRSLRVLGAGALLVLAAVLVPAASGGGSRSCSTSANGITNPSLSVVQGGTATAKFTISTGYCPEVTLASYEAPSGSFGLPQNLIDYVDKSYSKGSYTVTVNVSPCYYQVDLVSGPVIKNLSSNNVYGSRKLKYANGGSPCASKLSTAALPSTTVEIGTPVQDSAILGGLSDYFYGSGEALTFKLYGPSDPNCTAAPVKTLGPVGVHGDNTYYSPFYTPTSAGTYHWVAGYNGSTYNHAAAGKCGDPGESFTVTRKHTSLVTHASGNVPIGDGISDTATLSGGTSDIGGTITFKLYGPSDADCTGGAIASATRTASVSGNSSYTSSPAYVPTTAGTYRWVASYSGDDKNSPVDGKCNADNETVTVNQAGPTLNTQASGAVLVHNPITDTATLAGATGNAGGHITFYLYGPNDTSCGNPPIFTSAQIPVSGNGSYGSGSFTPTLAGDYRWRASYSGDVNNAPVSTSCNEANESVTVGNDDTPPLCYLSSTIAGPPKQIQVTVQDTGSGIATIQVDESQNGTVSWSPKPIPAGYTSPILVTATKTNQSKSSTIALTVTDEAGNSTTCDPIVPAVKAKRNGSAARRAARGAARRFVLRTSTRNFVYGGTHGAELALAGRVPSRRARQVVTILARSHGIKQPTTVAKVRTKAGGKFRLTLSPALTTVYSARWKGRSSKSVQVRVHPLVVLRREWAGIYHVNVSTANGVFLDGQRALLQRLVNGRWKTIREGVLAKSSPPDAMTAVSSVTLAVGAYGAKLRAVIAATPFYAAGKSAGIRG